MGESGMAQLARKLRSNEWAQALAALGCVLLVLRFTTLGASTDGGFGSQVVEVSLSGSASSATVTIDSGGTASQNDVDVPSVTTVPMESGDIISMNAQNLGGFGTITCTITAGGEVLSTSTSSTAFGVVACSARLR